jgi:hypothetical protein
MGLYKAVGIKRTERSSPQDYIAMVKLLAERRMVLAGYRLADVLKQAFP